MKFLTSSLESLYSTHKHTRAVKSIFIYSFGPFTSTHQFLCQINTHESSSSSSYTVTHNHTITSAVNQIPIFQPGYSLFPNNNSGILFNGIMFSPFYTRTWTELGSTCVFKSWAFFFSLRSFFFREYWAHDIKFIIRDLNIYRAQNGYLPKKQKTNQKMEIVSHVLPTLCIR